MYWGGGGVRERGRGIFDRAVVGGACPPSVTGVDGLVEMRRPVGSRGWRQRLSVREAAQRLAVAGQAVLVSMTAGSLGTVVSGKEHGQATVDPPSGVGHGLRGRFWCAPKEVSEQVSWSVFAV